MRQMMQGMPPPQRTRDPDRDFSTIRRVASAFHPYRWRVALILVLTILATVLGLVNPILTQRLFDDAIGGKNLRLLIQIVAIMAVTPLLSALITVWQTFLNAVVGQRVMQDFRNQLYAHLQRMPLQFFTSTRTGEIQSRLANDVAGIENILSDTFVNTVRNLSMAISTIIAMFVLSVPLTLISLALVPLIYLLSVRVGRVGREVNAARQQRLGSLTALMEETLSVSGAMLIKVFGRSEQAQRRFRDENERLAELSVQRQMIGVWLMSASMTLFSLAPVLIYLIAGWQIIDSPNPPLTIGTIIAFTTLQGRLIGGWGPITQLLNLPVQLQTSLAFFDRIYEYLDMPVSITEKPDAIQLDPRTVRGDVEFRRVWFSYEHDAYAARPGGAAKGDSEATTPTWVLRDVSAHARPGQLVALVGPSGAGKSTLVSLVSRLYDVDRGAVLVDGHDVRDLTMSSLTSALAVVTQETYLFHDTVRENLRFAREDATEAEVIAAARAAAIHDRILELEHGYDTVVGERGYKLSGGEKQRIAIARAILKDPRILILDEATSALDTRSERLVQQALARLMEGRTTLAIAHRLSTILAADQILVLDHGEIVERGTHAELVAAGGLYARLYEQQFEQVEAEAGDLGFIAEDGVPVEDIALRAD